MPSSLDMFSPGDFTKVVFNPTSNGQDLKILGGDRRRVMVTICTQGLVAAFQPLLFFGGTGNDNGFYIYNINTQLQLTWWNDFILPTYEMWLTNIPAAGVVTVTTVCMTKAAYRRTFGAIRNIRQTETEINTARVNGRGVGNRWNPVGSPRKR